MKNRDLFNQANDEESKAKLRQKYRDWCAKSGTTIFNPEALRRFLEEDVEIKSEETK